MEQVFYNRARRTHTPVGTSPLARIDAATATAPVKAAAARGNDSLRAITDVDPSKENWQGENMGLNDPYGRLAQRENTEADLSGLGRGLDAWDSFRNSNAVTGVDRFLDASIPGWAAASGLVGTVSDLAGGIRSAFGTSTPARDDTSSSVAPDRSETVSATPGDFGNTSTGSSGYSGGSGSYGGGEGGGYSGSTDYSGGFDGGGSYSDPGGGLSDTFGGGGFSDYGGMFERGGQVQGQREGGPVPITAHDGEVVMNRAAVAGAGGGDMARGARRLMALMDVLDEMGRGRPTTGAPAPGGPGRPVPPIITGPEDDIPMPRRGGMPSYEKGGVVKKSPLANVRPSRRPAPIDSRREDEDRDMRPSRRSTLADQATIMANKPWATDRDRRFWEDTAADRDRRSYQGERTGDPGMRGRGEARERWGREGG